MSGPARSLCETCASVRQVLTPRGSRFLLCQLSRTDPAYPKYPPQPVVRCAGYRPDKPSDSMTAAGSLFADLPARLPDELFTPLLNAPGLRVERIVSHGHASPDGFWYDQDQHEWVVLLQGAARLRFEDGAVELRPGDFVNIPAHARHRVDWTTPDGPTVWLAVHYGVC